MMAPLLRRNGNHNMAARDGTGTTSSSSPTTARQQHQQRHRHRSMSPATGPMMPVAANWCSKQSVVTLLLGMVVGYILLPVLLVEFEMDSILTSLQNSGDYDGALANGNPPSVSHTGIIHYPGSFLRPVGGGNGGGADSQLVTTPRTLDVAATVTSDQNMETYNDIEKRIAEENKLLAAQSIPTTTTPYVMTTPVLPDHARMKILVTGGAGFVGSHLVDKLMMQGHEVIVVDNFFTGQKKNIAHWLHHPNFSLMVHDVTEPVTLEVDQIYHLACPASPPHYQYNPVKTIKTSTMGTLNMLGLAKRVRARILLTSTSEIYGDPQEHPQRESYWGNVNTIGPRSCYDEGKRVAETMMYSYKNQNKVEVRVARIFNTFGPRMHPNDGRVVSNFIIQALQNKDLTIYGDGDQTRSFQYVSDLVDGLHALMNGKYDLPVNLGNPEEYSVKNFAEYIQRLTASKSVIRYLDHSQDDPSKRKPDITVAKRELQWEPKIKVEEGLKKTIAYFSGVLKEAGEIIPTGPGAAKPEA